MGISPFGYIVPENDALFKRKANIYLVQINISPVMPLFHKIQPYRARFSDDLFGVGIIY